MSINLNQVQIGYDYAAKGLPLPVMVGTGRICVDVLIAMLRLRDDAVFLLKFFFQFRIGDQPCRHALFCYSDIIAVLFEPYGQKRKVQFFRDNNGIIKIFLLFRSAFIAIVDFTNKGKQPGHGNVTLFFPI